MHITVLSSGLASGIRVEGVTDILEMDGNTSDPLTTDITLLHLLSK